jgi:hypothetical protein
MQRVDSVQSAPSLDRHAELFTLQQPGARARPARASAAHTR